MTQQIDLGEIRIHDYDLAELTGLVARILPALGADQAWRVMEYAAERVGDADGRACVYAVRQNPDYPSKIDELAIYPRTESHADWRARSMPLMVSVAMLFADTLMDSGERAGIQADHMVGIFHELLHQAVLARRR